MSSLKYVGIESNRIELEKSNYCSIYTSQATVDTWYKWLSFFPDKELEKVVNILSKELKNYTPEDHEIIKKYHERKLIAEIIDNYKENKYFPYMYQKAVEDYTKENNLNDIIEEKLSYYEDSEKEKVKAKVLKGD